MLSPFRGRFTISQAYSYHHDGLDMYALDDKTIYSTVTGTVSFAGWENPNNHKQGFGLYVSIIKDGTNEKYYFGHMSSIVVTQGQRVTIGQKIGTEGSTGNSTGSHCHYACRHKDYAGVVFDICKISGIPNIEGATYSSDTPGVPPGGGSGGSGVSTPGTISQQYMYWDNWNKLDGSVSTTMHGIKLQTPSNKPYYLKYRTYNHGHGWYPYVSSKENDYAGYTGQLIEAIDIEIYNSSDVKLDNTHVVMWRAYANGGWLPWVSTAPGEVMAFLQKKHNLGGDLDITGWNAGLPGSGIPIIGLEVLLFENVYGSGSDGTGSVSGNGGDDGNITRRFLQNGEWKQLTHSTWSSNMDGIELKTNDKDFYLKYQTYNAYYNNWYPWVTSEENDYAGSSGKPIQAIDIRVCDRNGNLLKDTHAVMYRAFVNGRWLPWVSNANPDIMRKLHTKYNLGGDLDTGSAYAGIYGQTINQLEIRVYKNVGSSSGSSGGETIPSGGGGTKIYIDAGHGGQYPGACAGGYTEKDLTLQISKAQRKYFLELGYNVMLCRDGDTTSELEDRTNAANSWPADIYISNHLNSFDTTARGVEVYYSKSGGAGKIYAEKVVNALSNQIGFYNRGAKIRIGDDGKDFYHVIRETTMPAILIEQGFIDNDQDRSIILSNIDKMAKATVYAIHEANPNKPNKPLTNPEKAVVDFANDLLADIGLFNPPMASIEYNQTYGPYYLGPGKTFSALCGLDINLSDYAFPSLIKVSNGKIQNFNEIMSDISTSIGGSVITSDLKNKILSIAQKLGDGYISISFSVNLMTLNFSIGISHDIILKDGKTITAKLRIDFSITDSSWKKPLPSPIKEPSLISNDNALKFGLCLIGLVAICVGVALAPEFLPAVPSFFSAFSLALA